jgi:hypothetical protein
MEYVFTRRLVFPRRVDEREVLAFVLADADETPFAIGMTGILCSDRRPAQDERGTPQIKTTLGENSPALGLVDRDPRHLGTPLCTQIKPQAAVGEWSTMPTNRPQPSADSM